MLQSIAWILGLLWILVGLVMFLAITAPAELAFKKQAEFVKQQGIQEKKYQDLDTERKRLQEQLNQNDRKIRLTHRLAEFITTARHFRDQCLAQALPNPHRRLETWDREMSTFLRAALGPERGSTYAARIVNEDGLNLTRSEHIFTDAEQDRVMKLFRIRLARLETIIHEIETTPFVGQNHGQEGRP